MGSGSYDPSAYATYSASIAGKSVDKVFASTNLHKSLDPKGVVMRESRDSTDNPNSTPLLVTLDITGSMGMIAEEIAHNGLGVLFQEVLDRKPITDPHLAFAAVGDVHAGDKVPFQISQFEADNRIVEQLANIYLEGNGGGNGFESYNLAWYFAGMHTVHDAFEKRGRKGYLFTIGDEEFPNDLNADHIQRVFGDEPGANLSNEALLALVSKTYHVFHVVVEEGNHCRYSGTKDRVYAGWRKHLGQHVLPLTDYTKLSEVIVSTMQVVEGADAKTVAASWKGGTAIAVANAIGSLTPAGKAAHVSGGVARF